jgi:hypothetical protein
MGDAAIDDFLAGLGPSGAGAARGARGCADSSLSETVEPSALWTRRNWRARLPAHRALRKGSAVVYRLVLPALLALVLAAPAGAASRSASTAAAWCQGAVSWQAARRSVGDVVRVKGRVVRSYYAASSSGRPTFLDLGRGYPDANRLTILIWGSDRANFPSAPERMFKRGTMLCAQGLVSRYRGVAQMEVALYDRAGRLLSF